MQVNAPEVIVIESDTEDDVLKEPGPEIIVIDSDLEDDDSTTMVVHDVPTVANQVRIGRWRNGHWYSPGNWRNFVNDRGGGTHLYILNEPPNDGVVGNLNYLGEGDMSKETLGGLLYNQWLHNKDRAQWNQVTIGESLWLDSNE